MKGLGYCGITLGIALLIIATITKGVAVKGGALQGLNLCTGIIIPSLLPILILTTAVTKSKCSTVIEKTFGWAISRIFMLPKSATAPIILGLIAGYPAGTILTDELYEQGAIDIDDAKRMLRYNFCGGVAFIINTVGTNMLNSTSLGVRLYFSNLLSAIIIGIAQGMLNKGRHFYYQRDSPKQDMGYAFIESVEVCTKNILIMCCYIIFFSGICNIVEIPSRITPLLEITNGIITATSSSTPMLCAYLGFGGICIHLQLLSIIKKLDMKYWDFLLHRILCGGLAYGICYVLELIYPTKVEVFSNIAQVTPKLVQVNTRLSVILLIGCVVLVTDLQNKKSKLI